MVNGRGRRFANEAANYNAFGGAYHQQDTTLGVYKNLPCWMIFNQRFLDDYGLAGDITGGAGVEQPAARARRTGSCRRTRSPGWPSNSACRRVRSRRPWSASTSTHALATIPISTAATASSTAGTGTRSPRWNSGADARSNRGRAVLRGRGQERCARHEGRPADRLQRRRTPCRRASDRGAVCGRERDGIGDGNDLRRRRRHAWAGDGLRFLLAGRDASRRVAANRSNIESKEKVIA